MQLSFEAVWLTEEIKKRGYAEFKHNIHNEEVERLIDAYADFTLVHPDPNASTMDAMLPDDQDPDSISHKLDDIDRSKDSQTEWHKYRTNAVGVGKPYGYTNRSFQETALRQARGLVIPPEDPKEFYHYTPGHYAAIAANHAAYGWGQIPPEVGELNSAFAPIHHKASQLITRVCSIIEEVHPEINKVITPKSLLQSPVRLLFYHPSNKDYLGAAHYDKAAMTLQLAESHRGLRVAPSDESLLEPVVRGAEQAAFFPGLDLRNHLARTALQPGWHDIVVSGELNNRRFVPDRAKEVCARWALIFFANSQGFIPPEKSATHTR